VLAALRAERLLQPLGRERAVRDQDLAERAPAEPRVRGAGERRREGEGG
jgi:hypothetical protein